jgi:UDP-3-O-[3-hydroxymyristoyl] N-acetylglucosamine deacetylase
MRRTIARDVTASGIALHCGKSVHMTLSPAAVGRGVVFVRADLGGHAVEARYDKVGETRLGTVIVDGDASIGVIEHLMAAVAGLGIDDLVVTLDGPEPPILDGDAQSYAALLDRAGFEDRAAPRRAIKVLKPVQVGQGEATAALLPSDTRLFDFEIDFPTPAIGRQHFNWPYSIEGFRRDIAPARTFGFLRDQEALNKLGLAKGANLDNTLVIDSDAVMNAPLMRFPDEFVRHKILDALGDMALAGAPLIARFEGRRSSHALNNALLRALFADPSNWREIEA